MLKRVQHDILFRLFKASCYAGDSILKIGLVIKIKLSYQIFSEGSFKINGIARILADAVIIYDVSNPNRSPRLPMNSSEKALTRKLMVIKTPLIKAGCSVSIELTSASKTGVAVNIINPIRIKTGNAIIVSLMKIKSIIKTGVVNPIIKRVNLRPILSEIEPEKRVPTAPEN